MNVFLYHEVLAVKSCSCYAHCAAYFNCPLIRINNVQCKLPLPSVKFLLTLLWPYSKQIDFFLMELINSQILIDFKFLEKLVNFYFLIKARIGDQSACKSKLSP